MFPAMNRFLLVAILFYAMPHVVLYARLRPFLTTRLRIPVLLGMLSLMSTFFAGFLLHRRGILVSKPIINLSFFWMAFIFWTFCAGLPMDAWNALIRLFPVAHRPRALRPVVQLRVIIGLSILAFSWSAGEGRRVRVRTLEVPGLSASRTVRIAMFSDLHLSPYGNRAAAERTIALLRDLKPDIILSGGDMVDAPAYEIMDELQALAALTPPLGKFAILGNHEFYTGLADSLANHEIAGFNMLRESSVEPVPGLIIAGVDDLYGHSALSGDVSLGDEAKALPPASAKACVILLKHRPVVTALAEERVDLQLSGHTHGGQIFPFHIVVRAFSHRLSGLYRESPRLWLYVTRGAGTWGPPLRLFAPPEVTLLVIPASS
jgi:predicted MPP superfamily phosphohydrolase